VVCVCARARAHANSMCACVCVCMCVKWTFRFVPMLTYLRRPLARTRSLQPFSSRSPTWTFAGATAATSPDTGWSLFPDSPSARSSCTPDISNLVWYALREPEYMYRSYLRKHCEQQRTMANTQWEQSSKTTRICRPVDDIVFKQFFSEKKWSFEFSSRRSP